MRVFRAYYQLSPNVDIKNELKQTAINITCYDKDGNAIKDPEIDPRLWQRLKQRWWHFGWLKRRA